MEESVKKILETHVITFIHKIKEDDYLLAVSKKHDYFNIEDYRQDHFTGKSPQEVIENALLYFKENKS